MTKVYPPELKKYMDKQVSGEYAFTEWIFTEPRSKQILTTFLTFHVTVRLNGARSVTGVVRGFDPFMNLVLDETVDSSSQNLGMIVIRGNAIMAIEALDRI